MTGGGGGKGGSGGEVLSGKKTRIGYRTNH